MALAQILYGEPVAAARAMFDPLSLSPIEQQREIGDLIGLPEEDGPFSKILRGLTNPIVVVGAIASVTYPVANLQNLTKFSSSVLQAAKRSGFLAKLKGPAAIFKDEPEILQAWTNAFRNVNKFKEEHMVRGAQIIRDFEKEAGRPFGPVEQFVSTVAMKNLHRKELVLRNRQVFEGGQMRLGELFNPGAIEAKLDAPLRRLTDRFRAQYDNVWNQFWGTPENATVLAEAMKSKKKRYGMFISHLPRPERLKMNRRGIYTLGKYQDDYLPEILPYKSMTRDEWLAGLMESVSGDRAAFDAKIMKMIEEPVGGPLHRTTHQLVPDPGDLARFPELVNTDNVKRLGAYLEGLGEGDKIYIGQGLSRRAVNPTYRMGFNNIYETYVNSLSTTYGWTLDGSGKKLSAGVKRLAAEGDHRASILQGTYIPIARGRLSYNQVLGAQQWANTKLRALEMMESPALKPLIDKMPSVRDWMSTALKGDKGPFSLMNVSGGVAGWLYLSTLGLNAGSASLNLLQNFLTTIPTLGVEATAQGMGRVFKNSKKYFNLRGKGLVHEDAMAKAWPDFGASGLVQSPITDEAVHSVFKYSWDEGALKVPGRFTKTYDQVKRGMMSMFTASESFNRLVAFEGAMWKGAKEGLAGAELQGLSRNVVAMTQFLSGPETTPAFLVDKSPLLRQYLMFPTKMLEFVTDTATSLGSGAAEAGGAGFLGRNWGTLGRAAMGTGLLYEGARAFDMDLSDGLLTGTLPVPRETNPFFPFPFVPPAVGMAGSVASALITGDVDQLRYVAPTLFPGGLAGSRALGFVPGLNSPRVAQALGRYYADYENTTPDGRIATYSRHGNLTGFETPGQIALKGLGIVGGGGEIKSEADGAQFMIKNRDRIRNYTREYLESLFRNGISKARAIGEEFKKAYGTDIGNIISKASIKAVHLRRQVTRMEKLLATLPPELRPQFAAIIQQVILSQGSMFLGVDPKLLGQGTPKQLEPYRRRQGGQGGRARQPSGFNRRGSYQQRMSPLQSLQPGRIGRSELPSTGVGAGLGFGGLGFE
jgi:hypothetical protein